MGSNVSDLDMSRFTLFVGMMQKMAIEHSVNVSTADF